MKDAKFTLEFTKHVLANSIGPDGKRDRFERDSDNRLIWQQGWWYSAFARAIQLAKIRGVKPADICMDLSVQADTDLYPRRWIERGQSRIRTHEAIMPGTKVTFEAMVADHVTTSILEDILKRMGQYVGLSPYGYRLGFGRFHVVDVEVEPSDSAETS
jgi:hypothetical protein